MHLQNRKISQHDSAMGLKKSAAEILEASKVLYYVDITKSFYILI